MSEIRVGDKVTFANDQGSATWEVLAVRNEWAWLFGAGSNPGCLRRLKSLKKIEPFFKVGKTYANESDGRKQWHIVDLYKFAGKKYAVAEFSMRLTPDGDLRPQCIVVLSEDSFDDVWEMNP